MSPSHLEFVRGLGLGLAALGRPGYINLEHREDLDRAGGRDIGAMEEHAHLVLDKAWRGGIRYIDAARSYGRAEEFLASWLRKRDINPSDIVVGSKWGYTYVANWRVDADVQEVKDHSAVTLRRQFAESRGLLGDYLALYQIHSATLDSGVLDDEEVVRALASLRDAGLLIGFTTSGPRQSDVVGRALEIRPGGVPLFTAVQVTWNALEPSVAGAARSAFEAGLLVIVKEALANGRLTAKAGLPDETARRALATALAQPWAGIVLSGATTIDQLEDNLAARDASPLTADDLAALKLEPMSSERYWAERSMLPWN